MHNKKYIILRDNEENGPFDINALMAFSLKADDLVWIEQESVGWLYPAEINELKSLVQPSSNTHENNNTAQPENTPQHHKLYTDNADKERHVYVSLPTKRNRSIIKSKKSVSDRLEKKALEIYKRVQAYNQQNSSKQQDDAYNKYGVPTLNELKNRYADWREKQKKKKKYASMLKVVVPVAALLLFATVYYIWQQDKGDTVIINEDEELYSPNELTTHELDNEATVYVPHSNLNLLQEPIAPQPELKPQKTESNIDDFIDSVERVLALQEKGRESISSYKQNSRKSSQPQPPTTDSNQQINSINNTLQSTPKAAEEKETKQPVAVKHLVKLTLNHSFNEAKDKLTELKVLLHNSSSQTLIKANVDVLYYKSNGKILRTETVQFKNVAPQSTESMPVAIYSKAAKVQCKLADVTAIQ